MSEVSYGRLRIEDEGPVATVQITGTPVHDGGYSDGEHVFTEQVEGEPRRVLAQQIAGDLYRVVPVPVVQAPEHRCIGTPADPSTCSVCTGPIPDRVAVHGEASMAEAGQVIAELVTALQHTVEYVGYDMLPAIPGWSWFDALAEHAPDVLRTMTPCPEDVILAHHRVNPNDDAGTCLCGWDEADGDSPSRSHALHVWERLQRCGVMNREELG